MSLKITDTKLKIIDSTKNNEDSKSVEKEKTESKIDKKYLLIASLSALGAAGAATFAIIKTKSSIKAKKALEQAKKAAAEEAKRLQEESKAAAERLKAQREAKQKEAEALLKEKLKKEAELKAKQEADELAIQEAAQRAKVLAAQHAKEKVHSETIKKLSEIAEVHNNSIIDLKLPINELINRIDINSGIRSKAGNTTSLTNEIISVLTEAETGGINISKEELKKILIESLSNPKDVQTVKAKTAHLRTAKSGEFYDDAKKSIEDYLKEYNDTTPKEELINSKIQYRLFSIDEFLRNVDNKNTYLKDILNILETTSQKDGQKTSEYLKNLVSIHTQKAQAVKESFTAQIRAKLSYANDTDTNLMKLSKEEKQEIANEFNKIFNTDKYSENTTIEEFANVWKHKYISGYTPSLSQREEQALLSVFERANPEKYYSKLNATAPTDFEHQPLYRWMNVNNIDDFLKQFEKEGSQYNYTKLQSCSLNRMYGEYNPITGFNNFTDWQGRNNVKFVIHPKGSTPNAAAMGEGKYGNCEVIYPAGQKFNYIGKIKKEISNADYPKEEPFDSFYRWEIHLQEA